MEQTKELIEIRSEEVQEIINKSPSWIVQWGNALILLMLVLIFLLSYFIKYPDVIETKIVITSKVPPEKVIAQTTAKFEVINVKPNQIVESGEYLAILRNSAYSKDILKLKKLVDSTIIDNQNFSFPVDSLPPLLLGEVSQSFSKFENDYYEYIVNKELRPLQKDSINEQFILLENKNRLDILISQKKINLSELKYLKKDLLRSRKLFKKGVISAKTKEAKEIEYLQSIKNYKNIESSISQIKEVINNSDKQFFSTKIKMSKSQVQLRKKMLQSFLYLKKSLNDWENKYVLKSHTKGYVNFFSFWSNHQSVKLNDLVFTIIPFKNEKIIGKIEAPIVNSGKIKKNQSVHISLHNFPSEEFGEIYGKINSISLIPNEKGNYIIDVELPNKLITSVNKEIPFKQEMQGQGNIITEDLTLLQRIFYSFNKIFKR